MLTIEGLDVFYSGIHALRGVSLRVEEGEVVTLIGANGAGKTTTLRAVSGIVRPASGQISFQGKSLLHEAPERIVKAGIAHAPEGRRIFAEMTVRENLDLGAYSRSDRAEARRDMDRMLDLFPRLRERLGQTGGTLSGGEQQMLAIARALMARPRLLLLDEPSLGLAPFLVRDIFKIIQEINGQGVSILLVEQNANKALQVAHRAYVMETGRIVLEGKASEIAQSPEVKAAYLGG
ncbi:MAG TPA: ABC transporter ATP-binding protein [Armatimonadota bacterium]|jgi:branched-chain amino acid transport system ATP-binding protein